MAFTKTTREKKARRMMDAGGTEHMNRYMVRAGILCAERLSVWQVLNRRLQ